MSLLFGLLMCVALGAPGQPPGDAVPGPVTAVPAPGQSLGEPAAALLAMAAAGSKEEPSPWPKFEEVTKGMESHPGLFTLWYYPQSAKDKDTEKLLCQIPASFLGQKFMLSTSQSGGGCFPIDEQVVKWEVQERQLLLIQPQSQYVVDDKGTISDVVRRSHPDRIRAAVPIVTKSPGGDPVIDLGPLLKGSLVHIGAMFDPFSSRMSGGGVNPSLSKWLKKKTFELNVEIGVELAVGRGYPPGSYGKQLLHYSLWKLPVTDYKPRIADDRVGYFLTANQDWSKPTDSRDLFNRYIDRWNLVKRDPSLPRCEVKEPIVFYVEKTVPVRFRKAVRDGILEWNKAYDKCGFIDAVQVRQQTEDNEWKDLDPEDMRYSFFRWIVTGGGFAMGPHRSNPFTGQIYDADIVFDDSLVRFQEVEARTMMPSALAEMKMADPGLRRYAELFPQWMRSPQEWGTIHIGEEQPDLNKFLEERMRERGIHHCDYARGMMHQLVVAQAALADQPKEVIDRLLYDVVKEVACHEVGHTLGLRHNFKASSIYSLEEIRKRRKTGEATTGSVMDYNPVLYFSDNPSEGFFVTPTLGPWDYWVIEYGYRPADGSYQPPKKETKEAPKKTETAPSSLAQTAPGNGEKKDAAGIKAGSDIPAEVMSKLPPNVRKLIEAESGEKKAGPKAPPSGEEGMLLAIAARAAEPDLAYATDEDTTMISPDPRSNRFDAGSDPIDWARERMAIVNKRMANLLEWAAKDGESWYHVRSAFLHLVEEKAFVLDYVGRYIGGQYTSRSHRGDPDAKPPFELVDAKTQRKALNFIEESMFSDKFFAIPPKVLAHLTVPRWYHEDARVSMIVDFPVHEMISMLQWWNLFDRLFPITLQRIQDAEWQAEPGAEKLTVAEYFQAIQRACWADAVNANRRSVGQWSDASPFLSDVRRSLQREYLNIVEPMVRTGPGRMLSPDQHAMMQHSLTLLSRQIDDVLKQQGPALDFASQAHLATCKSRIDRMLSAPLEEYSSRGGMMMMGYENGKGKSEK